MMYSCGSNNPKRDHTVELLKSADFDESRRRERVAAATMVLDGRDVKGGKAGCKSSISPRSATLVHSYAILSNISHKYNNAHSQLVVDVAAAATKLDFESLPDFSVQSPRARFDAPHCTFYATRGTKNSAYW